MAKEKSLHEQTLDLMEKSGKTDYRIAKDAGLNPATLRRVKGEDWGEQIRTLQKVLSAVGHRLAILKD